MGLVATSTAALGDLITEVIRGTTPRITYQQVQGWKPYEEAVETASVSRRFRLLWEEGDYVRGGFFTNGILSVTATLRVRTDYAGEHEKLQHLRQDDLHQLRGRMSTLTPDPTNGLVSVQIKPPGVVRPPNWDKADVGQFDLLYSIHYVLDPATT
jgi:hypothetical protein